jgi:type IV fimbrial biogenesis protein FimT
MAIATKQSGYGLVHLLTGIAICAVLTGMATNHWGYKITNTRVNGRAQELIQDLHWLRSQAVASKQKVRLSVLTSGNGTCYVVHTGASQSCACNDSGQAVCQSDAQALKTIWIDKSERVSLSSNSSSMVWDPQHGTTTPTGTLKLQADNGQSVNVVVNVLGRVRACSEGGLKSSYPSC